MAAKEALFEVPLAVMPEGVEHMGCRWVSSRMTVSRSP